MLTREEIADSLIEVLQDVIGEPRSTIVAALHTHCDQLQSEHAIGDYQVTCEDQPSIADCPVMAADITMNQLGWGFHCLMSLIPEENQPEPASPDYSAIIRSLSVCD